MHLCVICANMCLVCVCVVKKEEKNISFAEIRKKGLSLVYMHVYGEGLGVLLNVRLLHCACLSKYHVSTLKYSWQVSVICAPGFHFGQYCLSFSLLHHPSWGVSRFLTNISCRYMCSLVYLCKRKLHV